MTKNNHAIALIERQKKSRHVLEKDLYRWKQTAIEYKETILRLRDEINSLKEENHRHKQRTGFRCWE